MVFLRYTIIPSADDSIADSKVTYARPVDVIFKSTTISLLAPPPQHPSFLPATAFPLQASHTHCNSSCGDTREKPAC